MWKPLGFIPIKLIDKPDITGVLVLTTPFSSTLNPLKIRYFRNRIVSDLITFAIPHKSLTWFAFILCFFYDVKNNCNIGIITLLLISCKNNLLYLLWISTECLLFPKIKGHYLVMLFESWIIKNPVVKSSAFLVAILFRLYKHLFLTFLLSSRISFCHH